MQGSVKLKQAVLLFQAVKKTVGHDLLSSTEEGKPAADIKPPKAHPPRSKGNSTKSDPSTVTPQQRAKEEGLPFTVRELI